MRGFRDIHAHFVYGVDDGAQTREDMQAMLDVAYDEGIVKLISTPHVTPGVSPFDWEKYHAHLDEARAYAAGKGYHMTFQPGAEILYTPAMKRYAEEQNLPTLGDTDYVLVEFVPDVSLAELKSAINMTRRAGYRTILAHIERYECMYHENAYRIKDEFGVEFQMNCSTVTRDKGGFFRTREVKRWLQDQLIDYLGSDAHNVTSRPPHMCHAYEVITERCGIQYASRLTGMPLRKKSGKD